MAPSVPYGRAVAGSRSEDARFAPESMPRFCHRWGSCVQQAVYVASTLDGVSVAQPRFCHRWGSCVQQAVYIASTLDGVSVAQREGGLLERIYRHEPESPPCLTCEAREKDS